MWSDWRPDIVERDFQQLKALGVRTVRCFPLWPVFQPLSLLRRGGGSPVEYCFGEQNSDSHASQAINEILATHRKRLPFTAIISCSSPGSIVAMRVLHEYGWRVPQDCSVICMQEDPIAPYTIPALTNLKWDYLQWGEHCVTLIEKRLHGDVSSGQQFIKIVPEFNWRESVDKAPAS